MARKERPRISLRTEITPGDLDSIRRITAATGYFRDDETEVAVELAAERLARGEASGYHFLFADTELGCAGYACWGPIGCTVSSHDLYWIAVDPEHQGAGVGTILIEEVERRVVGMGGTRVYVETSSRPSYEPTRRFYESRGYRTEAVLEDFYAPGDGKAIFVKRLGS